MCAALAAALVCGCGGGGTGQGEATAAARPSPADREIHDTLRLSRRYMSVLRGPGKPLPRGLVASGQRHEYGVGERGWYATSVGLAGIYLVPARQHLCLLSTNHVSSNCFPRDQVAPGSAASVICSPYLQPGTIEFAGIIPDGARSVTVIRQHGQRLRVPVVHNVFVFDIPQRSAIPRAIEWRAGGERHRIPPGIRLAEARLPCGPPPGA
ncbi:MAG: hypothetical protein ACTHNP_08950 [Solirubrobacterales bacterium]